MEREGWQLHSCRGRKRQGRGVGEGCYFAVTNAVALRCLQREQLFFTFGFPAPVVTQGFGVLIYILYYSCLRQLTVCLLFSVNKYFSPCSLFLSLFTVDAILISCIYSATLNPPPRFDIFYSASNLLSSPPPIPVPLVF